MARLLTFSNSRIVRRLLGRRKQQVSVGPVFTETLELPGELRFLHRPGTHDPVIAMEVFTWKVYDRQFQLAPGNIVVDVGAHIGAYTIKAAREVSPSGLVIAVEPHEPNYQILLQNVRINNLKNVIPKRVALLDFRGTSELLVHRSNVGGHSMEPVFDEVDVAYRERVNVTTLDILCKELGISRVDVLKIDVEGGEAEVLRGAQSVLSERKIKIAAEVHREKDELEAWLILEHAGFQVKTLKIAESKYLYAWRSIQPSS